MATIYEPEDVTLFGPVENTILNIDEESEEDIGRSKAKITVENSLITKGRNRVTEKIKEMRQRFFRAVIVSTSHVTNGLQRFWVKPSNGSGLIPAR